MHPTRRRFLIGGLEVTASVPLLPLLRWRPAPRAEGGERALVVLQLTGGNDGLNMVVPQRQDAYWRARPTLGLARGALQPLDEDHGLHPRMGSLARLFADGEVALVHGVGYPDPDRSHFRSMEVWHGADPAGPRPETGWLGRLADQIARTAPGSMPALFVGGGDPPLSLRSRGRTAPSVEDPRGFRLDPRAADLTAERGELLGAGASSGDLSWLREAARDSYRAAQRMAELAARAPRVDYPPHPLARRLQLVARLIDGGFGTRLFQVELAGFDTHARQGPVHAALLAELSESLAAFQRDLDLCGAGRRVTTLVFSEFGRRVEENGSRGTDHGAAAPVLLTGGAVRGGMHGTPPDLERLTDGDVAYTTDFRSVYAALERDWMGLEASTDFPSALVIE